ncbi:putative immunity protein [uncultured Nocardioides sp.]|uniref:putative immunity protein n=1 Tax=uncultured Nocardioides sp. TaxID=198441 RepID=UPI0026177C67|nr:exonuclease SbcC [uncultured Nocardioides sp.]
MHTPDVELDLDDLRAVRTFTVACARRVLDVFERATPGDDRPRQAVDTARAFAAGGRRTHALRTTALAAHRAARAQDDVGAHHAAMAAGDAAASAYLHPLAEATQVGHIVRAAAHAVLAVPEEGLTEEVLALADERVRDVLSRYPRSRPGTTAAGRLAHDLDGRLRR